MGKKSYSLESIRNKKKIVPMELNQSLAKPLCLSFTVALIGSLLTSLPILISEDIVTWTHMALRWIPIITICYYLPSQALVSEYLYGTKHRLLCGLFYQSLESKCFQNGFPIRAVYSGLKWLSRRLGRHVLREEVKEICCVAKAYLVATGKIRENGNGRWLRGAVQELNQFVMNPNFYKPDTKPVYDTYKRHSRRWAEEGETLFRTREQAEFESWT